MAPDPPGYVISTVRSTPAGTVVYEIVTDRLQRAYVNVPRRFTDNDVARAVIDHALAALHAPTKPI